MSAKHIARKNGRTEALKEISLALHSSGMVFVTGRSGSGTLLAVGIALLCLLVSLAIPFLVISNVKPVDIIRNKY